MNQEARKGLVDCALCGDGVERRAHWVLHGKALCPECIREVCLAAPRVLPRDDGRPAERGASCTG